MAIKQWDPEDLPKRPGLYINFTEAAEAQVLGGARGIVAIPLKAYGSKASEGEFYTVTNEADAEAQFGKTNIQSIRFALAGGAKEVLVYAMPATPDADAYNAMREEFEARPFNVFVFDGEIDATEQAATLAWLAQNRTEKKHFMFVAGGSADDDKVPATGDARSATLKDEYIANLINGVVIGSTEYSSGAYAPYIAGLIAGTPINKSITYAQVAVDDVTKRMRNAEIVASLTAGSLVLVHDGDKVKVEQGIATSGDKIRKMRARQAIATDLEKLARDNYIGKVDNNPAGQAALVSAFKLYLETLENENVLVGPDVQISETAPSVGDQVYVDIAYTEMDSMERIFVTINAE